MNLFKRRKSYQITDPVKEQPVKRWLSGYQRRLADWLNIQSEKISLRTKKVVLIGIYLFSLAYIIGLVIGSIRYKIPGMNNIIRPVVVNPGAKDSKEAIRDNILMFRNYMDSLSATHSGRRQRDSILKHHPGLMDSIARLEQLINHNK